MATVVVPGSAAAAVPLEVANDTRCSATLGLARVTVKPKFVVPALPSVVLTSLIEKDGTGSVGVR